MQPPDRIRVHPAHAACTKVGVVLVCHMSLDGARPSFFQIHIHMLHIELYCNHYDCKRVCNHRVVVVVMMRQSRV